MVVSTVRLYRKALAWLARANLGNSRRSLAASLACGVHTIARRVVWYDVAWCVSRVSLWLSLSLSLPLSLPHIHTHTHTRTLSLSLSLSVCLSLSLSHLYRSHAFSQSVILSFSLLSPLAPVSPPLAGSGWWRHRRRHPLISLATPPFFIFSLLKRQMDKVYCKVGSALGKTARARASERARGETRTSARDRTGESETIRGSTL